MFLHLKKKQNKKQEIDSQVAVFLLFYWAHFSYKRPCKNQYILKLPFTHKSSFRTMETKYWYLSLQYCIDSYNPNQFWSNFMAQSNDHQWKLMDNLKLPVTHKSSFSTMETKYLSLNLQLSNITHISMVYGLYHTFLWMLEEHEKRLWVMSWRRVI